MKTPPPPPLLLLLMVESLNKNFKNPFIATSLKANIDKIEYYPVPLGLGLDA